MLSQTVPCSWGKKGQVMRELLKYTESNSRELIDGVRVLEKDAWALVMPDRRKASFHIFAEATREEQAKRLLEEYVRKINDWQK